MTKAEKTELMLMPPAERALVVMGSEARVITLKKLVKESEDLVEVKDTTARDQIHGAYMKLKNTRIEIEKVGETAREDAKSFNLAVLAEQRRLVAITDPEEERLKKLRDEFDQAAERERAALAEANRARIQLLQDGIAAIRAIPGALIGKPSADISAVIKSLQERELKFDELQADAAAAVDDALKTLGGMFIDAKAREDEVEAQKAEAARLKAAAEELAQRTREQEERERLARAKIEEEERAAKARIQAAEDEAKALRQAEERRIKEESDRVEAAGRQQRMEQEARERAEREKKDAAEAEQRRVAREAQERADAERRDAERAAEDKARGERLAAEQAENTRRAQEAAQREAEAAALDRVQKAGPVLLKALISMEKCLCDGYETKEQRHADRMALIEARAAIALATEEQTEEIAA